jgi:hypothetical protein
MLCSAQSTQSSLGFFVPQALLLDERLTPLERNAWLAFRSLADNDGTAIVSYESLRPFLPSAPAGGQKAALETVSRAVLCLRLSAWIELAQYRRDSLTGFGLSSRYVVRTESLPFAEACLADSDYLLLIERALRHASAMGRQLVQGHPEALQHLEPLARLPASGTREQIKRLHRKIRADGSDPDDSDERPTSTGAFDKEVEIPNAGLTGTGIPKSTAALPATVRTVESKVLKKYTLTVPTLNSGNRHYRKHRRTDRQRGYVSGNWRTVRLLSGESPSSTGDGRAAGRAR